MKKIYRYLLAVLALQPILFSAQSPCSGVPATNTVIASATNLCPGNTVTLSLQNPYTTTGMVYQWAYSTASAVGPWTALNGANAAVLITTTLSLSGWYTCVIACQNSFQTTTATAVAISIGATNTTTNIPYYENFENPVSNGLPNCSWSASSLGQNCISFPSAIPAAVPCSGQRMLGFSYSLSALGTHEFFTQGFNLQSALVYSVAVWQTASNYFSANNWSQFGIGLGTSASAASGTVVYSTTNPVVGPCTSRSATFTVPSGGIYYLRLFATAVAGTTIAPYLTFDDLSVTAPCSLSGNAPSFTLTAPANSVCPGTAINLTVTAAPGTTYAAYPATSIAYTVPSVAQIYQLAGTNTLSGCTATRSLVFLPSPTPSPLVLATPPVLCSGRSATISVVAGSNLIYTLQPGSVAGTSFVVSPVTTTNYSLVATTTAGCLRSATLSLLVNPAPIIQVTAPAATVCIGESYSLGISGAVAYSVNSSPSTGTVMEFPNVQSSMVYTISGISANACTGTATFQLLADACTGLAEKNSETVWQLRYSSKGPILKSHKMVELEIFDLSGKKLRQILLESDHALLLNDLAPGMYVIREPASKRSHKLLID